MVEPADGQWGVLGADGQWTGLIGQLQNKVMASSLKINVESMKQMHLPKEIIKRYRPTDPIFSGFCPCNRISFLPGLSRLCF